MVWLIASFYVYCKADDVYHKDESSYYLRKILGVGCEFIISSADT